MVLWGGVGAISGQATRASFVSAEIMAQNGLLAKSPFINAHFMVFNK